MSDRKLRSVVAGMVVALGLAAVLCRPAVGDAKAPELDVPFEPSHPRVVETMLKTAKVTKDDIVYDLGCGDGRIVVMAAKKFGAHGVGMDLHPERIKESKENARNAGVTDRVKFWVGDIFDPDLDLRPATVVTMYLLPRVNLKMRPRLFRQLRPGTRCVSHAFHMADWEHDRLVRHKKARGKVVYLWIIPAPVGGAWRWTTKVKGADQQCSLTLVQEFQGVRGTLTLPGADEATINNVTLTGRELTCAGTAKIGGQEVKIVYSGTVDGDVIKGTEQWQGGPNAGKRPWTAKRKPVGLAGTWVVKVKSQDQPLDGTLRIERKDGVLTATYVFQSDKRLVPLPAFYVWGESVRFDIPTEGREVVFRGSLGAEAGSGTVHSEGWASELPWTAKKQEK